MSDIVDKLDAWSGAYTGHKQPGADLAKKAADEIRQQREEIKLLRRRISLLEDTLSLQVSTEFGKCPL